jgi:hypothetical protein
LSNSDSYLFIGEEIIHYFKGIWSRITHSYIYIQIDNHKWI